MVTLDEALAQGFSVKAFDDRDYYKQAEKEVRNDWQTALEKADRGEQLSYIIGWGFYPEDLIELAGIHQENEHLRERIENLLTDCNFHPECEALIEGDYARLIDAQVEKMDIEPNEEIER